MSEGRELDNKIDGPEPEALESQPADQVASAVVGLSVEASGAEAPADELFGGSVGSGTFRYTVDL